MGEQQQLVAGMKPHQRAGADRTGRELAQPAIGEDALDEVLAQARIAEPSLFFERQQRLGVGEAGGEQPAPRPFARTRRTVQLDAEEAARRRVLFQHVAVEIEAGHRAQPGSDRPFELTGHVAPRAHREEAHLASVLDEMHRLARRPESSLHLGTDRHPLDERSEQVGQKRVAFVPAVVAHFVAEEAR